MLIWYFIYFDKGQSVLISQLILIKAAYNVLDLSCLIPKNQVMEPITAVTVSDQTYLYMHIYLMQQILRQSH